MNKSVVYIVAIVLIALGVFGLARGRFSYTEEKHEASIGNVESFRSRTRSPSRFRSGCPSARSPPARWSSSSAAGNRNRSPPYPRSFPSGS